ncbi:MAG: putative OB-fold protein [Acidimicrobiales bacterium]|jgi:uncharacterized protein
MQPAPITPDPTPTSQPFWDALTEGRVELQQCDDCRGWVYYPRSRCSHCLSANLTWTQISGEGTLYTYTVARQPTTPAFDDTENLLLAVVELDEGPKVTTSLEGLAVADIEVGMRLKPLFVPAGEQVLLRYQPI